MKSVLLGTLAVLAAVAAVWVMRSFTMSTDTVADPDSRTRVVVSAAAKREPDYTLAELATTLVQTCRVYVDAQVVAGPEEVEQDTFRYLLQPGLNDSDQLELKGCLQDARLDHVQLDVLTMDRVAASG